MVSYTSNHTGHSDSNQHYHRKELWHFLGSHIVMFNPFLDLVVQVQLALDFHSNDNKSMAASISMGKSSFSFFFQKRLSNISSNNVAPEIVHHQELSLCPHLPLHLNLLGSMQNLLPAHLEWAIFHKHLYENIVIIHILISSITSWSSALSNTISSASSLIPSTAASSKTPISLLSSSRFVCLCVAFPLLASVFSRFARFVSSLPLPFHTGTGTVYATFAIITTLTITAVCRSFFLLKDRLSVSLI